jgi:hypothetical protein
MGGGQGRKLRKEEKKIAQGNFSQRNRVIQVHCSLLGSTADAQVRCIVRIHRTCTSTLYPWESTANAVALYSRKESTAEKFSLTHGTSTRARYQEEYARQNPSAVSIESRAQDVVCVRKGSEERNRCRWADAGSKPVFALVLCENVSYVNNGRE